MLIDKTFSGKICVITGAASGIGRALALRLHDAGAILALCDVDAAGLAETKSLLGGGASNHVMTDILDVADADAITDYAGHVAASLGNTDYLFNVAGLARVGTFDKMPLLAFETVMNVNFYGVVRMSKAFLGQLKQTRGGLINISSIFGIIGYPGQTHYCASKFAVRGFSETLAQEVSGTGVSVSCVHPGGVATNIARNAKVDVMPDHGLSKEQMDAEFDKVALTTADKAAAIILTGAAKGKRRIIVGGDAKLMQFINRLFPQNYWKIMRAVKPDIYKVL